jgi:Icc protein
VTTTACALADAVPERPSAAAAFSPANREALWFGKAKVPSSHTFAQFGALRILTLQSLTESSTATPGPAGAFALLQLGDSIGWTFNGQDPFTARIDAKQTLRR